MNVISKVNIEDLNGTYVVLVSYMYIRLLLKWFLSNWLKMETSERKYFMYV